jgi:hypothetical protein
MKEYWHTSTAQMVQFHVGTALPIHQTRRLNYVRVQESQTGQSRLIGYRVLRRFWMDKSLLCRATSRLLFNRRLKYHQRKPNGLVVFMCSAVVLDRPECACVGIFLVPNLLGEPSYPAEIDQEPCSTATLPRRQRRHTRMSHIAEAEGLE